MNTSCLTYNQIERYSKNTNTILEREKIYNHMLSCELCAFAVNGFASAPFSINEVVAIDSIVDKKTKVNSLTFAKALIVVFSVAFIFIFYFYSNSFNNKTPIATKQIISIEKNKTTEKIISPVLIENKITPAIKAQRISNKKTIETQNKTEVPNEINPIKINNLNDKIYHSKNSLKTVYSSSDFYLHNCKIANYSSLYFKPRKQEKTFLGLPPFIENKDAMIELNEQGEKETITLIAILNNAIEELNLSHFEKAIVQFNKLLNYNSSDINALFYSGIANYNLNDYDKAIKHFEKTLSIHSNAFREETNWHLAICYLKNNEIEKGKKILEKIESENGFYAERAKEKLKTIK